MGIGDIIAGLKKKLTDNEGMFQQGRFMPAVNAVNNIRQNVSYLANPQTRGTWLTGAVSPQKLINTKFLPGQKYTIGQAAPKIVNNLPQDFSNIIRGTGDFWGNKVTPKYIPGVSQVRNMAANQGQVSAQGFQNFIKAGVNLYKGHPLEAGANALMGYGQSVVGGIPLFQAANMATQARWNPVQRVATGVAQGMSGTEKLSPEVQRKYLGKTGIDPLEMAGSMAGFVKNPTWKKIFPATEKILKIPGMLGSRNPVVNYVVGRLMKGGAEGWIQGLSNVPLEATDEQRKDMITKQILIDAGMELGGDMAVKALGKSYKAIRNSEAVDSLVSAINTDLKEWWRKRNIPVKGYDANGQPYSNPMWREAQSNFKIPEEPKATTGSYSIPSQRTVEAFNRSTDQVKVAENGGRVFEIGTFGKNAQNRKAASSDRFDIKEIPATIRNIVEVFRGSNDPTNYRYDNASWVAKMPNGEKRIIYTRLNKNGAEEIINWHKVSNEDYLKNLKEFGIPDRTRTGMSSLEGNQSVLLAYRDNKSIQQPSQKSQELQDFLDGKIKDTMPGPVMESNLTPEQIAAKKKLPGIMYTTSKKLAEGKAKDGIVPGIKVRSADRGNIGTVLKINDDGTAKVLFNNRKDRLSATVDINIQKLQPLKSSTPRATIGRSVNMNQDGLYNRPNQQQGAKQILAQEQATNSPVSGNEKIGEPPVADQSQGIINSVKSNIDRLYTQAIDRFHPLSKMAKQAGNNQAMENAITQHYGAGSTATYHVDFELSPILKNTNVDDLKALTIAQRDIELARRGIKGSDEAAGQAVIDGLKSKYGTKFTQLEDSARKLYAYQDGLVKKYLVDTGVISKQAYEGMRAKNQFYIPFKRVMDEVDGFLGVTPQRSNVGSVGSQGVIKGIKGSDRQIIDPLQSIVENTYKIVSLGQRNKVAKTIVSMKEKLPDMIRQFDGEVGNRKDIISVMDNGKVLKYQVPLDVAEAAKGLNEESLNSLIKILAVPSKLVRATATGYNPEFLFPNIVRDAQSAFVNAGLNPLKFISGVTHMLKRDQVFQDFLRSGSKTSTISLDRPYLQKTVGEISGKKGVTIFNPIRILQTLGEYSEQPTRIAVFEQTRNKLLKEGLSGAEAEVRAAHAAQEATVNFARSGSKMKAANALVTFLNARVQGADQLFRTVKKDPAGALFRMGLITQIPAVLSYLYNRNFSSYNDERVVSKYDKQNNFIIMLSDKPIAQLGGAQFIKIPKGDIGRFANPTENFLAYLDQKGDNNAIVELAKAFGGLSPFQNIGDAIPAAIKPPIEWAANRSFFTGQPLVPEYKQSLPPKYQYTSKTAPLYKIVGDKINASPAKLENLTSGYLTGFEKLGNYAFNKLTGQKPQGEQGADVNRIPLMRRFLGGEKRTSEEQTAIDEKRAKSIDFQINDVKSAIRRGDIPMGEGQAQIEKLRQQQAGIINGITNNQSSGASNNIMFTLDGKLKEIDLNFQPTEPTLTGNTELDKKLISKYNGEITQKANDIRDLYLAGKLSSEEAEKQLNALVGMKSKYAKAKKPKKIKLTWKKMKAPKIKVRAFKMPKIKLTTAKNKVKLSSMTVKAPKPTKVKIGGIIKGLKKMA